MLSLSYQKSHLRFFLILAVFAVSFFVSGTAHAAAVSCPATDGGAGDDDASVDGTITISSNATWTMSGGAAGDYWDCTGVDLLITSSSTLSLQGDTAAGTYAYIKTDNLQVDSGSSISADERGCLTNGTGNGSMHPNTTTNVCTTTSDFTTQGGGQGAQGGSSRGAGGGANGGDGGKSENGAAADWLGGVRYGTAYFSLPLYGSSGGEATGHRGGYGGGVIRLEMTGTFTHNGTLTADGGIGLNNGSNDVAGGGAGGSIHVVTGAMAGSTGVFGAGGANAVDLTNDGGAGGGGRIYVGYNTTTYTFDSSDFDVGGGDAASHAPAGGQGTVIVEDVDGDQVTVYDGFYHDDDDSGEYDNAETWSFDSGVTHACASSVTTPDIGKQTSGNVSNLTLAGTITCSASTVTTFSVMADTSLTLASGTSLDISASSGATLDFTVPDNQTWTNVTITGGTEGSFTINDGVSIDLAGTTSVTSNVYWENLVGVTVGASAEINASGLGCDDSTANADGDADTGSFTCTNSATGSGIGFTTGTGAKGSGGGGYGGAGGAGDGASVGAGGSTYGDNTAPTRFGASGGTGYLVTGGFGGGGIYIELASGTFSHSGDLIANGGNGSQIADTGGSNNRASGGGSGGSIYLNITGTYSGSTGTFSADGGNGGEDTEGADGGGGGGGRVAVLYQTDSSSILSGLSAAGVAAGGTGPNTAVDGSTGSLYTAASITPPDLSSASTVDNDGNGQIDQIIATFDKDMNAATIAGSDFTVAGYTVSSASETSAGVVTIILTESGTPDTDATMTVSVVASVESADGGELTSDSVSATDGAAPAPTFGAYKDTNADGTIDRIDITFSENIGVDECEVGDYTAGGADAGSITVASCANSGDDLRLTISNAPSNDTNLTLTVAYTAANGTASSLDDAAGNAVADISATALADGAAPLALSSSYTDADSNSQVDRLDVLFTESIAVDECEAGDYTIGGADAGSIAVSGCTPSGSTMQFTLSNASGGDTNLALQISYTAANGTANSLDDATGNAVADFGALTPTDAAVPLLGGISINDTNNDGLIDQLIINFSENIDTNDSAAPVLADFGTITLPDGNTVSSATITDPAGSTAFITLTDVVGQVTPNTGAGSTGIDGITNEWSDGVNLTSNPDDSEGIIDDAFPRLRTDGSNAPAYQDNNTDGTVDRVKLVFTEAVTITYSDGDWSAFPNDLPSFDVSGISSGNGTNTVYLTGTAQSNTTGTGGGTEPQLSFTNSTGSISDGSNTLNTIFNQTLTDDAAPALRTDGANVPTYLDNNNDGTIDRVQLTFTEAATVTYNDGDWTATANDLTSFDVGAYLSGNGTTQILLTASAAANLTGVSGATEPTLAFTPSSGSIVDSSGASLSGISATSLNDGAQPVSTAYAYKDADANGQVDRMDITFTEGITVNECEVGDYGLTGSDSGSLSYSACATSGSDLRLTITGAPSNDTNLALEFAYDATNGTSNSLDDANGLSVANIATQTATDGARPVLTGFTYDDTNTDGQIDQVTAVFTEDVTVTYSDGDWSVTANDLTNFDVTGYDSGNGSPSIILTATADAGLTGVSGGSEPTISFTPSAGSISDGTVSVTSISSTGVVDNAAMGVTTSAYKDTNTDGQIDRLDVTFSETPGVGECETGDYAFSGVDAGTIAVSACAVSGNDLRLTLNNAPTNVTNLTIQWSYDASAGTASSLEDGGANAAPDYVDKTPTDGAAPLRLSQAYTDSDSNGTVDRFDITFTEDIAVDECEAGDFTIGGSDAGGLSISSCATSEADLQLSVAGGSSNDTFYTLTLAYAAANGTANSLDDAAGNAVGNLSGSSLSDNAAPVATTLTYTDNDSDGQVDRANLTFSETISLDECETEDWVIGGADAGSIAVVDASGCAVSSPSITFTLSGAPANDTALAFSIAYADNGTTGSFKDQGSVELGALTAITLLDAAIPLQLSQTYLDTNGDGSLNRLDVSYTEPMTIATCEVNDHIFGGADAGSIAIGACAAVGSDIQYTLLYSPTNDTNLTLTYEYDKDADTSNSLKDGNNNVLADQASASIADGAAPVLRTDAGNDPKYFDTNYDGQVDAVIVNFTENTTITYSDGDWSATANDLTGLDVSGIASGNGTSSITLTATANAGITGVSGGTQPTIAYTNTGGSIVDGSANERTSFSATSFSDSAAPAAVSQNYKDTNNDGQVDRVDITFSELIEQDECESADFSFGGTDTGAIAVSSCAISTNDLRLAISNAPAQDTNLDLTWSYDASNGTANSLDDSDGNGTGDQTAKTLADAAAPLLISSTPANSATDIANDADVILTFTEPMDTGSLTYSWTNYSNSSSVVWSSGNTIATVTPTDLYDPEAVITFEVTAADDAFANSMTNTISTHPFSFTVVLYEPASNSSGSLYVEKAGQYTSLYIYDVDDLNTPLSVVIPGQDVSIVWVHNGNITTTEVYYQIEEQNKGSTLIDLVFDGGTQSDWTIPTTTAMGQDLIITTVNAQKVSYSASATVTIGEEEEELEEEVIEEEPAATSGQIRTDTSPGVYSTFEDGTRRVFLNSLTYFTWHEDFDGVETVETPIMSDYALTGVMLPKAGSVLVKIQSIPNVYYLEENPENAYQPILRWIPDEETAIGLFGEDWALSVVDIEPTFFTKFTTSDDPLSTSDISWIDADALRTREDLAQ